MRRSDTRVKRKDENPGIRIGGWGKAWIALSIWIIGVSAFSWFAFATSVESSLPETLASVTLLAQLSLTLFLPVHLVIAVVWGIQDYWGSDSQGGAAVGCMICTITVVECLVIGYFSVYRLLTITIA